MQSTRKRSFSRVNISRRTAEPKKKKRPVRDAQPHNLLGGPGFGVSPNKRQAGGFHETRIACQFAMCVHTCIACQFAKWVPLCIACRF